MMIFWRTLKRPASTGLESALSDPGDCTRATDEDEHPMQSRLSDNLLENGLWVSLIVCCSGGFFVTAFRFRHIIYVGATYNAPKRILHGSSGYTARRSYADAVSFLYNEVVSQRRQTREAPIYLVSPTWGTQRPTRCTRVPGNMLVPRKSILSIVQMLSCIYYRLEG